MKKLVWFFVALFTVLLTGCAAPKVSAPPPPTGYHAFTPAERSLAARIRASGAQVIKRGDTLRIIIPVDRFFARGSVQLKRSHVPAVRDIARLVRGFIKRSPGRPKIQVLGFSDKIFAQRSRRQLSYDYASTIASHLWQTGIPRRRMMIRGMGARQPIASQRTPRGAALNRRVEIRVGV